MEREQVEWWSREVLAYSADEEQEEEEREHTTQGKEFNLPPTK